MKKGYSWSDQIGIAISLLVDGGRRDLVTWTQEVGSITPSLFCAFILSLCILPFIWSAILALLSHSVFHFISN